MDEKLINGDGSFGGKFSRRDFLKFSGGGLLTAILSEIVPTPEMARIGGELILHGLFEIPDTPGWLQMSLFAVDLKTGERIRLPTPTVYKPGRDSVSPDGNCLVFKSPGPTPNEWRIYDRIKRGFKQNASGQELLFDFNAFFGIRWTPDGKSFIITDGAHIEIVDTESMERRTIYESPGSIRLPSCRPGWPNAPVFSYMESLGFMDPFKIGIVNSDLESRRDIPGDLPEWSPDGKILAYRGGSGRLCLFAYKKTLPEGYTYFKSRDFTQIGDLRWSPSGDYVSFTDEGGKVCIMNTWTYAITEVPTGASRHASYVWLARDYLAVTNVDADTGPGKPPQVFQILRPSGEEIGRIEIPVSLEDKRYGMKFNMDIVDWWPSRYDLYLPLVVSGSK